MFSSALSKYLRVILAAVLGLPFSVRVAIGQAPTGLNISVVPLGTGVAATSKTEREFSVQVQDVSTGAVRGAQVEFSVPEVAAGAFPDGSKRAVVFTDLQGTAVAPAFRFTRVVPIPVQVQASFRNQTAITTLRCCDAQLSQSKTRRRNAILGIAIAGAVGVSVYYATRGGPLPPTVIRIGTPTLGSPR